MLTISRPSKSYCDLLLDLQISPIWFRNENCDSLEGAGKAWEALKDSLSSLKTNKRPVIVVVKEPVCRSATVFLHVEVGCRTPRLMIFFMQLLSSRFAFRSCFSCFGEFLHDGPSESSPCRCGNAWLR